MKILLFLPSYNGEVRADNAQRVWNARERFKGMDVLQLASSFLTYNFNLAWCRALNRKEYTHFVMLHADIVPKREDWLDRLIQASHKVNADVMSAVIPLKMPNGQTSTALMRTGEHNGYRRLTMTDAMELPELFNKLDVAKRFGWDAETSTLLANTGVMIVNMKQRDALSQMCFTVNNWIQTTPQGEYVAMSEPEDWNWSRQAAEKGLSVWATRAVPAVHVGTCEYPNDSAWGDVIQNEGN